MKEKTIILPENLSERRSILQTELNAVIEAQVTASLQDDLKRELNAAGFTEGTATLEWEFQGEYDDEGGTDYWPTGISLVVNGESIDMEEIEYQKESRWNPGQFYNAYLPDNIADIINDEHSDLYDQYITEITITLH